jgi:hypothetical protein
VALEDRHDAPIVSLHSITDISTTNTMYLHAYIYGHRLLAFLDNGSTHNFVNVGVVHHIRLVTMDTTNMQG